MRRVLLLAALFAGPVSADLVARQDGAAVRLYDKPCAHADILAMVPPQVHPLLRAGVAEISNRSIRFCWAAQSDQIVAIDEDGDVVVMALGGFKDEGV